MFVSFAHSRHSSVQDGKTRLYLVEKRLEIAKFRNIRFFALQHHVKVFYGMYMNTTEIRQVHGHKARHSTSLTLAKRISCTLHSQTRCTLDNIIHPKRFRGPTHINAGLRRRSAAARLLRLWVRIPLGAWMVVFFGCCVLSGRGPCLELIPRPEESYRLWCVVVCDLENSRSRRPWPTGGARRQNNKQTHINSCTTVAL